MKKPSFGLLVWRLHNGERQYLLAHASGDKFARQPFAIPKGQKNTEDEDDLETACREVFEETGIVGKDFESLGTVKYKTTGKVIHCWMAEYASGEVDESGECVNKDWENDIAHFYPLEKAQEIVREEMLAFLARAEGILDERVKHG